MTTTVLYQLLNMVWHRIYQGLAIFGHFCISTPQFHYDLNQLLFRCAVFFSQLLFNYWPQILNRFTSGELPGQSKMGSPFSWRNVFKTFDLWHGARSCWWISQIRQEKSLPSLAPIGFAKLRCIVLILSFLQLGVMGQHHCSWNSSKTSNLPFLLGDKDPHSVPFFTMRETEDWLTPTNFAISLCVFEKIHVCWYNVKISVHFFIEISMWLTERVACHPITGWSNNGTIWFT